MQFADGTFDAVIDKGGLDALMEPELGPKLGNQYLSEVLYDYIYFYVTEDQCSLIGRGFCVFPVC